MVGKWASVRGAKTLKGRVEISVLALGWKCKKSRLVFFRTVVPGVVRGASVTKLPWGKRRRAKRRELLEAIQAPKGQSQTRSAAIYGDILCRTPKTERMRSDHFSELTNPIWKISNHLSIDRSRWILYELYKLTHSLVVIHVLREYAWCIRIGESVECAEFCLFLGEILYSQSEK